jgi:hypothetical protein
MAQPHNQVPAGPAAPSRRTFLGAALTAPIAALPLAAAAAAPAAGDPPAGNPDADLMDLCERIIETYSRREKLADADTDAQDRGPNHAEWIELDRNHTRLCQQLICARAPTTFAAARAMARVALQLATHDRENRIETTDFAEWLSMKALVWAAGTADSVLVPSYLPINWRDDGGDEREDDDEAFARLRADMRRQHVGRERA